MRLGAMLIRDGRLSPAQVEAALAQQARMGGRLGTVLMEMRLLDADTLTVYLGLDLGIPIATRAALERAKRAAVRLLPPELSERLLCVPLVVQDRQLIVAMRDPHDLLALDELAAATGYRIIPRVAPEARLYYYVERYYGVPRPLRFRALGDSVAASPPRTGETVEPPPPPLPGLPPQLKHPVVAPPPAPVRPLLTVLPPPASAPEVEDELAIELAADDDEPAGAVPPAPVATRAAPARASAVAPAPAPARTAAATTPAPAAAPTTPAPASARTSAPPRAPAPPVRSAEARAAHLRVSVADMAGAAVSPLAGNQPVPAGDVITPIDGADALARMETATSRSEVADALMAYSRGLFDVAALFVVREDIAYGWRGFGRGLDAERVEALLVPLQASSMFRAALDAEDLFVGPAPPSALHAHLYRVLRASAPRQAVVATVVIRERVVNLLYGHRDGERTVDDHDLEGLRDLTLAASRAYVRLIALHKQAG